MYMAQFYGAYLARKLALLTVPELTAPPPKSTVPLNQPAVITVPDGSRDALVPQLAPIVLSQRFTHLNRPELSRSKIKKFCMPLPHNQPLPKFTSDWTCPVTATRPLPSITTDCAMSLQLYAPPYPLAQT